MIWFGYHCLKLQLHTKGDIVMISDLVNHMVQTIGLGLC